MIGSKSSFSDIPLMGVWDLRTESVSLGGLLNLSVMLPCKRPDSALFGICFIRDELHSLPTGVSFEPVEGVAGIDRVRLDSASVLRAVTYQRMAFELFSVDDLRVLARESESSGIELWPRLSRELEPVLHHHESTLGIQREFSVSKEIPVPRLGSNITEQATELIRRFSYGKLTVAIHVKNVRNSEGTANGRIEVWAEFMERVSTREDVAFFVVGNDDYRMLRGIPGVTCTQDHTNTLELDLAIIQVAHIFMGTASGPAHVAILGDKPYGVFKPLDVHREHMDRELGGKDNFPFARAGQQFHRIDPDAEFLTQELKRLIESVSL